MDRIADAGREGPSKRTPEPAEVDLLVREIIGRVADKWTMLTLEVLDQHGRLRFTQIGRLIGGISQKMLTQTLREMERDGLLVRTVFPVVPPRVEYELTPSGKSLCAAFCEVWHWAERNHAAVAQARAAFENSAAGGAAGLGR